MRPSVPLKAVFALFLTIRAFLAETYHVHSGILNSLGNQKLFYRIRSAIAKSKVVLLATPFVRMSLKGEPHVRIRL